MILSNVCQQASISGATSRSRRRTGLTKLAKRVVGVGMLIALAGHRQIATIHTTSAYVQALLGLRWSWFDRRY